MNVIEAVIAGFDTELEYSRSLGLPDPATEAEFVARATPWLKRKYPDIDDEVATDQARLHLEIARADGVWSPAVAKPEFRVGETVEVAGEIGGFEGFIEIAGVRHAVVIGVRRGRFYAPVEHVKPGRMFFPDPPREPWQKTWAEYRADCLKGFLSGGRTRAVPHELRAMKREHEAAIFRAIHDGRTVPAAVLAEYPWLA